MVDTGPLLASVDHRDRNHERCVASLQRLDLELVTPALVVAEVIYFLGERLGPRIEAAFLNGLAMLEVLAPAPEDWVRISELVAQYEDFPLGGVDASVVALAERLETDTIITLDRRHFGAVRPRHCAAFRLLPEQ